VSKISMSKGSKKGSFKIALWLIDHSVQFYIYVPALRHNESNVRQPTRSFSGPATPLYFCQI